MIDIEQHYTIFQKIHDNLRKNPPNYDWFLRQYRRKRISRASLKVIREAMEILQHVYPDKWEMQVDFRLGISDVKTKITIKVIIKFDEIEIKNSANQSHTIKDLLVKFRLIKQGSYYFGHINGVRLSMTPEEHSKRYAHSHLPSSCARDGDFSGFCTGSAGVAQGIVMLQAGWDKGIFQLFLFQLEEFLSWESLEGGPYKKMNTIRLNANVASRVKPDLYTIFEACELIPPDSITLKIEGGRVTVADDDGLREALVPLFAEKYHVAINEKGEQFTLSSVGKLKDEHAFSTVLNVWWKGKLHERYNKLPLLKKLDADYKIDVNSALKEVVIKYLKNKLTKQTILRNEHRKQVHSTSDESRKTVRKNTSGNITASI